MKIFYRCSLVLITFLLSACNAVSLPASAPTPLSAPLAAEATAQFADAGANVARAKSAEATREAEYRATAQAANVASATMTSADATRTAIELQSAQANLDEARLNVTLAALSVISTSHAITVSAQAQEVSTQATATAVAKQTANGVTSNDADTLINIISGVVVKIGIPILLIIAAIIALRKWQQHDLIQQPHKDGPAFEIRHKLLCAPEAFVIWNPHDDPRYQIAAPMIQAEPEETAPASPPIADDEVKIMFMAQKYLDASINYERYLSALNKLHNEKHHHGWNGRQLLTARECYQIKLFSRNDDWQAVVNWLVGKHICYSREGNTGIYSWDTLGAAALALAQIVSPYSAGGQIIDQNEAGTPGEQGIAGTGGNTREHAGTGQDSVPKPDFSGIIKPLPMRNRSAD